MSKLQLAKVGAFFLTPIRRVSNSKLQTEVDSVFSVEARHVNEVDAAANNVASGERRSIRLTTA